MIMIIQKNSHNLPISSISNNGQSRDLPQQARRWPINQTNQKKQKHSAIQAHHQIQPQSPSRIEAPLQKIGENQKHIKNNGLHNIEPNIATEIRVSNHDEV